MKKILAFIINIFSAPVALIALMVYGVGVILGMCWWVIKAIFNDKKEEPRKKKNKEEHTQELGEIEEF